MSLEVHDYPEFGAQVAISRDSLRDKDRRDLIFASPLPETIPAHCLVAELRPHHTPEGFARFYHNTVVLGLSVDYDDRTITS